MTRITLFAAASAATLLLVAVAPAARRDPAATRQDASKLETFMQEINATVKSLHQVVESKSGLDAALPDVAKLEKTVIDAKSELPAMVAEMQDAKAKQKATIAYKLKLQDLLRACLDLETAMLNDDAKKADKALREIDGLKSAGHSQFRKDDGR